MANINYPGEPDNTKPSPLRTDCRSCDPTAADRRGFPDDDPWQGRRLCGGFRQARCGPNRVLFPHPFCSSTQSLLGAVVT
jgi:hypothetical protein